MSLFSVIVPIYRVEQYLVTCIESLINQTFTDIEIILVDDGSPDCCPQICDKYSMEDHRIKVIHKNNGGLVSARKAGCEIATGEYIINVDGDDWIARDYCEKMAGVVERYHPDIVFCGFKKAYDNKTIECKVTEKTGFYNRDQIEEMIIPSLLQNEHGRGFNLNIWAKATKTNLQKKYQGLVDDEINIGEDIACMAPCVFSAESLYIMEDSLYYYRQNPFSMTKSGKVYSWEGPQIRGNHIEKTIDLSYGNMEKQLYRFVTHCLFTVVKSQFNRKNISLIEIKRDIIKNLNRPYYHEAINRCRFKGFKANMMKYSLKYRLMVLIMLARYF